MVDVPAPTPDWPVNPDGTPAMGPVAVAPADRSAAIDGARAGGFSLIGDLTDGPTDLSLLEDLTLRLTVDPNPWREHEKLAAGSPVEITEMAAGFARAGGHMDEAHQYSTRAQQLVGQGFTNNGAQVYDQRTHLDKLPKQFPDAGTRLTDIARRVGAVGQELTDRTTTAKGVADGLAGELHSMRTTWADQVRAVLGPDGRTTEAVMASLVARRQALIAQQKSMTSAAGGRARDSINDYRATLSNTLKLLGESGFLPDPEVDLGPGDIDFTPDAGTQAARDTTDAIASSDPGTLTRVDGATAGIGLLTDKIRAGGVLTDGEQAYLSNYYGELAKSGGLARLEGAVTAAAPQGGETAVAHTTGTVADGLMALSRQAPVPPAVLDLLNAPIGKAAGNGFGVTPGAGGGFDVDGVARYAGVANLVGRSTITGSDQFVQQLGQSALHAKQQLNATADGWPYPVAPAGTVDPGGLAAINAQERARIQSAGEVPINKLLGVVARNAGASQALLGNAADRHTLLGAGWQNGSGAAAVLHAATTPSQATPTLATGSAQLTGTIVHEIADDPYGWGKLIPRGSDVRMGLARMMAEHIGAFSDPSETLEVVDQPQRASDGSYSAPLHIGDGDKIAVMDGDRGGFVRFLASGGNGDASPEMVRVRAAADAHVLDQMSPALHSGDQHGYVDAARQLNEYETLFQGGEYVALRDQGADKDAAAAAMQQNSVTSVKATERTVAAWSTYAAEASKILPKPLDSITKDVVNVIFDSQINNVEFAPADVHENQATSYFALSSQEYEDHRNYIFATALLNSGRLNDVPHDLIVDHGALRSLEDIQHSGAAQAQLADVPIEAVNDDGGSWKTAIGVAPANRYDPSGYVPSAPRGTLADVGSIRRGDW